MTKIPSYKIYKSTDDEVEDYEKEMQELHTQKKGKRFWEL